MYDIVNNVFYTNQGTGAFTYGSVVDIPNPDYPQDINVVTGEQNVKIKSENLSNTNNIFNGYISANGYTVSNIYNRTMYIEINDNTKYHIEKELSSNSRFCIAFSNEIPQNNTPIYNYIISNNSTYLEITNTNYKYLCIWFYTLTDETTDYNEVLNSLNIYTSYQTYPINLGNIELCRIGDYQDYIYNQNGDWYLHKETNKILLDGNDNKLSYDGIEYGHPLFHKDINDIIIPKDYSYLVVMSTSYGTFQQTEGDITSPKYMGNFKIRGATARNRIFVRDDRFTSTSEINDWLLANNVLVYYVMQNAINTQITDTTLIQQLDNLKNATLYNGVNNISVDGNLPSILNLHYNFVTARIDTTLLFSGVVKNTGNINLNPRYPHYCNLQILDYSTFLSESDTLDFVINNKTIPEAIEQVIQSISSYGFVLGNIDIKDTTSIIGAYSTLDKTPYDVFEYLSEISESIWFTRMVDENTIAIDFYNIDYLPQNDDLEYTSDYFKNNKINDIEYDYSTNDYRNKQIIKSSQVYGNVDYVETILANGYDKTFSTSNNIGIINSITINGVEKTIGTEEDKEIGFYFDFYYEVGKNTFENNETDSYAAGTQIVINYTPLIKGRESIYNNSEILRINNQTQRKGIITRYENRDDILSADELNKVAQSYIKKYSNPEIVLKVNSSNDFLTLGSKIFFDAPLDDLKKEYLVKKKTTYIKQAGDFSLTNYQYELSSTFNLNNEINYFDNQRRKSEGNISTGEYITRNIDIENTANIIWDNLTITEVTITGDNVLNSPLNSPLIQ
jgi:hypothetical protein